MDLALTEGRHHTLLSTLPGPAPSVLALMGMSLPAAIEAMKNAHREEMERELEKSQRSQISSVNSDIEALRRQYL